MKITKINQFIEYSSVILILSYLFIHNIYLVLIGIIFSIYLININFIDSFIGSINKDFDNKKSSIRINRNVRVKKINSINIELENKERKDTLVETVEELGFIPSLNKEDQSELA